MINGVLFRKNLKNYWKMILLFCGVLAMYFSVMSTLYDPDESNKLLELMTMIPSEMASALGFSSVVDSTLTGFLVSFFYGFLIIIFPMIFNIILTNGLVAKHTDRGSLVCMLATPNSRLKIITTQVLFLITSNVILVGFLTGFGIFISQSLFPGLLDVHSFINVNLYSLCMLLCISGIGFFSSCIFNDTRGSLAIGAGLPIAFLLVQMLRNMSDSYGFLDYLTVFSLFDAQKALGGTDFVLPALTLLGIGFTLMGVGIAVFNKRDLPV